MSRDFETLYYEQQANFTESNGMLTQENEGLRKKVEALTAALADEKSKRGEFADALGKAARKWDAAERRIAEYRHAGTMPCCQEFATCKEACAIRADRAFSYAVALREALVAAKEWHDYNEGDTLETFIRRDDGFLAKSGRHGYNEEFIAMARKVVAALALECGHEICTHQHRILGGACAQCGDVTINGAGASSRESPRNEAVVADSSVPGKAASPLEPSARPSGATNECVHQVNSPTPEGWKLVPLEPTVEMKIAGDNAPWWCADKYRAMLAAAPTFHAIDSQGVPACAECGKLPDEACAECDKPDQPTPLMRNARELHRKLRHQKGCFSDIPGAVLCQVCGGDLECHSR